MYVCVYVFAIRPRSITSGNLRRAERDRLRAYHILNGAFFNEDVIQLTIRRSFAHPASISLKRANESTGDKATRQLTWIPIRKRFHLLPMGVVSFRICFLSSPFFFQKYAEARVG